MRHLSTLAAAICSLSLLAFAAAEEPSHGFLACGSETYIANAEGEILWQYPHATRDGYVLADGKVLLVLNNSKEHPGGAVVELDRETGAMVVIWKGTQSEVNSAQPTKEGTYVITEAGPKPRLIEVDRNNKILVEFPLTCQRENHHMQTRMARKLADGTYLAPHLLDFAVHHYDRQGTVLGKIDTTADGDSEHAIHTWPFTAIRHGDGQTLVCCTHSNRVVDYDKDGKITWQLTNEDLPGPWLQDPCGSQLLSNGNVVITSYAAGRADPKAPKLFEVTPDKQVVWTYADGKKAGIHHFQILTADGQPLKDFPLK